MSRSLPRRDLDLLNIVKLIHLQRVYALVDAHCRACTRPDHVSRRVRLESNVFDVLHDVFFDLVFVFLSGGVLATCCVAC